MDVDETATKGVSSIRLPPSIFDDTDSGEDVGLVFTYYDTASLFPLDVEDKINSSTVVASSIIGAIIGNKTVANLKENITILLPLKNLVSACACDCYCNMYARIQCMFVDVLCTDSILQRINCKMCQLEL